MAQDRIAALRSPGARHRLLEQRVGKWNLLYRVSVPNGPPVEIRA
jgi:hypothetical protein